MLIKDRYINPFTDFGFKKIFGSEVNKDLLIAFLNTLLSAEAGTVADLSFLPKLTFIYLELPKFTKTLEELATDFLKIYRDLKNVVDTAYDEGKAERKTEEIEQKALEDAKRH